MEANDADFSGYATKAGLKCSDGRTITAEAFKHMDGAQVPLVWQHSHSEVKNVLGHARLEARDDGVYAYGFFNDSENGVNAKRLVQHGDVDSLSIYANNLVEKSKVVLHGVIRELSLVLSGANPGARIENVRIAHGSGDDAYLEPLEDEAIIALNLHLEHGGLHEDAQTDGASPEDNKVESNADDAVVHADSDDDETVKDVYDTLTDKQKDVVHFMIGAALEAQAAPKAAQHSDTQSEDALSNDSNNNDEGDLTHQEGTDTMSRNVFDQTGAAADAGNQLTHSQFAEIVGDVKAHDGSLKASILAHAAEYGIEDINFLFPDAKTLQNTPELHSRRMEWVAKVLDGTRHSPFAKVKTIFADITADEARAKGYVKGTRKVDEVFTLLKRTTGPTTIYKKQRLDRDDVLDITDMDVVAFLKAEMRIMIEEEVARAILVGDGRSAVNPDKVKDPAGAADGVGIRSILNDDPFYVVTTELEPNVAPKDAVKAIVRARTKYRGTGKPTLFISDNALTDMMLEEDKFGRALYETEAALADKLRVRDIVTVDVFDEYDGLYAILVNLQDYTVGANRGGELTSFEDFDIDFNQMKYLQETRLSGGLTRPFSAVVIKRSEGTVATPAAPSFDGETNTVTIPASTGVVYQANDETVPAGALVIDRDTEVEAVPDEGYYFASNTTRSWTYTYTA